MKILKEVKFCILGAVLALIAAPRDAHAQAMTPFISSTETLAGGAGKVDIVEVVVEDPNPFPVSLYSVGYFVNVKQTGVQVGSFAVSISDFENFPLSTRPGWGSAIVSASAWDAGTNLPNGVMTTTLGAYSTFFDASSPGVAFFNNIEGSEIDEDSDSDVFTDYQDLEFGLEPDALPASDLLVFDLSGGIIDGSLIPEPSSAILGLLAFTMVLRRRR